jgi:L-rhamnose-H+ transport protein
MAFGFSAGSPIADAARLVGTHPLWVNNAVLVVILLGGFVTNALWCIYLMIARGSWSDFLSTETPRSKNFSFAAIAGVTWYLQFMFYGMGSTKMGDYEFTSWTLHMSFIIIASNLWSLYLKEWSGAGKRTITWLIAGILVIGLSTLLIGLGNYLQGAAAAH